MKHIAVNAISRRSGRVWPTPGLGDRALVMTFLANYTKKEKTNVTLHINKHHASMGRTEKWQEIAALVPKVKVKIHDIEAMQDRHWKEWLNNNGAEDVSLYWFTETPTPEADILIHDYLKTSPRLKPKKSTVELPEKFFIQQWDSTDPKRRCNRLQKEQIQELFKNKGYELITVGGEAESDQLKYSLADIAYAMSKAEGFVGVNSGMFCLAHMYIPFDKIYFYGKMGQDHVQWFAEKTKCNFNFGVSEFRGEK